MQTIWHTKAAANDDHNDDKNENQMMIKFYPVLSGQWADKCTCWQQQQKRQLLLLRPWKEETEKEQQRWEENKNRSDKFVDLSKAKADQEMQASRKKNKTKLVFESGKDRDSKRVYVHVCGVGKRLSCFRHMIEIEIQRHQC